MSRLFSIKPSLMTTCPVREYDLVKATGTSEPFHRRFLPPPHARTAMILPEHASGRKQGRGGSNG